MKWDVQIGGDTNDLRDLSKSLKADELRVFEKNGQYYLESSRFASLSTPEQVESAASEIMQILTGAVHLALGGKKPLVILNVARVKEDGEREVFVFLSDTAHGRDSLSIQTEGANGIMEVIHPADTVPDWVSLGLRDSKVAKALRLLGTEENDWVSLYRIYEVIENDTGGMDAIVDKSWTTKASIKRFKHTANSPSAVGDASRHGKESTVPPPNPMELGEARALVQVLLHNWLRSKLKQIS